MIHHNNDLASVITIQVFKISEKNVMVLVQNRSSYQSFPVLLASDKRYFSMTKVYPGSEIILKISFSKLEDA